MSADLRHLLETRKVSGVGRPGLVERGMRLGSAAAHVAFYLVIWGLVVWLVPLSLGFWGEIMASGFRQGCGFAARLLGSL